MYKLLANSESFVSIKLAIGRCVTFTTNELVELTLLSLTRHRQLGRSQSPIWQISGAFGNCRSIRSGSTCTSVAIQIIHRSTGKCEQDLVLAHLSESMAHPNVERWVIADIHANDRAGRCASFSSGNIQGSEMMVSSCQSKHESASTSGKSWGFQPVDDPVCNGEGDVHQHRRMCPQILPWPAPKATRI